MTNPKENVLRTKKLSRLGQAQESPGKFGLIFEKAHNPRYDHGSQNAQTETDSRSFQLGTFPIFNLVGILFGKRLRGSFPVYRLGYAGGQGRHWGGTGGGPGLPQHQRLP